MFWKHLHFWLYLFLILQFIYSSWLTSSVTIEYYVFLNKVYFEFHIIRCLSYIDRGIGNRFCLAPSIILGLLWELRHHFWQLTINNHHLLINYQTADQSYTSRQASPALVSLIWFDFNSINWIILICLNIQIPFIYWIKQISLTIAQVWWPSLLRWSHLSDWGGSEVSIIMDPNSNWYWL